MKQQDISYVEPVLSVHPYCKILALVFILQRHHVDRVKCRNDSIFPRELGLIFYDKQASANQRLHSHVHEIRRARIRLAGILYKRSRLLIERRSRKRRSLIQNTLKILSKAFRQKRLNLKELFHLVDDYLHFQVNTRNQQIEYVLDRSH